MFKAIFLFISLILSCSSVVSQSLSTVIPFTSSKWNLIYADEFNGVMKPDWVSFDPSPKPWGDQVFSSDPKYLGFGIEGSRNYLKLSSYVENIAGILTNVTAGIHFPEKVWDGSASVINPNNKFGYGYYEIESRLERGSQSLSNVGLWPAYWFIHGGYDDISSQYWYEEVDIFEPGACQVRDNNDLVHYWTVNSSSLPHYGDNSNTWMGSQHEGSKIVDMFGWHKYGLEWLPDRLVFYYDNIPFHVIMERVPNHFSPDLNLDLQMKPMAECGSPKTISNTYNGSFEINYFRYYESKICSGEITEIQGDNFNFSTFSNSPSNVKKYCIFKNTSIPSASTVTVYSDNVLLKSNFSVPLGSTFSVSLEHCK